MNIQSYYLEMIKNGTKTFEGRIYDEKREIIQCGDIITFCDSVTDETISKRVLNIYRFSSFEKAFLSINVDCCLPGKTINEAIIIYNGFGYIEKEKQFGVVFFELKEKSL